MFLLLLSAPVNLEIAPARSPRLGITIYVLLFSTRKQIGWKRRQCTLRSWLWLKYFTIYCALQSIVFHSFKWAILYGVLILFLLVSSLSYVHHFLLLPESEIFCVPFIESTGSLKHVECNSGSWTIHFCQFLQHGIVRSCLLRSTGAVIEAL